MAASAALYLAVDGKLRRSKPKSSEVGAARRRTNPICRFSVRLLRSGLRTRSGVTSFLDQARARDTQKMRSGGGPPRNIPRGTIEQTSETLRQREAVCR